jgi:tripartite-type tricarboxylate transporter receptor subunit TctC
VFLGRAAVPDLPTATEAGYPSLALDGLVGRFGPKTLPPGTAERIAADVQAVAADPAIGPRLALTGQQLDPGGTAKFAAAVETQRQSIAATAKALRIRPLNCPPAIEALAVVGRPEQSMRQRSVTRRPPAT